MANEDYDNILYTNIGQCVVIFNELVIWLCLAKLHKASQLSKDDWLIDSNRLVTYKITPKLVKLFDSIRGQQHFVDLCKCSQIIDENDAKNIYTQRNDIIHSMTKANYLSTNCQLRDKGIHQNSLLRLTYKGAENFTSEKNKDKLESHPYYENATDEHKQHLLNQLNHSGFELEKTQILNISCGLLQEFNDKCRKGIADIQELSKFEFFSRLVF